MLLLGSIYHLSKLKSLLFMVNDDWQPRAYNCGMKQSPIALNLERATKKKLGPLYFYNYNKSYPTIVRNNGDSIEVVLQPEKCTDPGPVIAGGNLKGQYALHSVHFHWASEHTIEDKKYPLEAHMIHYERSYTSLSQALYNGGVVVVAVMYNVSQTRGKFFESIAEAVQDLRDNRTCDMELVEQYQAKCFLPKNHTSYYTYEGSVTTSPFVEGVIWIVFDEPADIQKQFLRQLTGIIDDTNTRVTCNNRALQDIGDREVVYTCTFRDSFRKFFKRMIGSG